jgi:hypothetical protein
MLGQADGVCVVAFIHQVAAVHLQAQRDHVTQETAKSHHNASDDICSADMAMRVLVVPACQSAAPDCLLCMLRCALTRSPSNVKGSLIVLNPAAAMAAAFMMPACRK